MVRRTPSRVPPTGLSGEVPVDRKPQYLPLPLGGLKPAHRAKRTRPASRWWRRHRAELVAGCGVLLAASAAVLSLFRPPASVYLEGDHVYVDGITLLHPASNGGVVSGLLYEGAATLLIIPGADGEVMASAVTFLHGEKVTGVCRLAPPAGGRIAERCQLQIGPTSVDCRDSMLLQTSGTWQRRCSDGKRLSIAVPTGGALVPMPFPLGET